MNIRDNSIKIINILEKKYDMKCLNTEMQPKKVDKLTFLNTLFRLNQENRATSILLVFLDDQVTALDSSKYISYEMIDKVKRIGNTITVTDKDINSLVIW